MAAAIGPPKASSISAVDFSDTENEYLPPMTVRGLIFSSIIGSLDCCPDPEACCNFPLDFFIFGCNWGGDVAFFFFLGYCEIVGGVGGVAFSYPGLSSPGSGNSPTSSDLTVLADSEDLMLEDTDLASASSESDP